MFQIMAVTRQDSCHKVGITGPVGPAMIQVNTQVYVR